MRHDSHLTSSRVLHVNMTGTLPDTYLHRPLPISFQTQCTAKAHAVQFSVCLVKSTAQYVSAEYTAMTMLSCGLGDKSLPQGNNDTNRQHFINLQAYPTLVAANDNGGMVVVVVVMSEGVATPLSLSREGGGFHRRS